MAKKKPNGNKSQAIREALQANPDKGPKEIAEALNGQGYKVTPAYVSIIKSQANKANGKARRVVRRKVGRKRPIGDDIQQSPFFHATALVMSAGGLDQAQAVLDQIKQIREIL